MPKKDLIAEVQMLLEKGQLKIGRLAEADRLERELMDMKMSLSQGGRGADGGGWRRGA